MEVKTTVVVPRKERKFTEAGSRMSNMYVNAKLFMLSWDVVSPLPPLQRKVAFENMKHVFMENGVCNLGDMDMFFTKIYDPKKPKLLSIMKGIEECLAEKNLLTVNERMVFDAITKFINTSRDITSIGYLKQIINIAYCTFYDIGREWKWSANTIVDDMTTGKQLFHTGNPLTESSIRTIIENFKKSEKRKTGQYTVKVNKKQNLYGENDNEYVSIAKHGLPASVPIVFYIMMSLFAELLTGLTRISDCRRLVNIANLIMMYAFCLHEGARPGDTAIAMMHDKLIFHLGEEFPILTLVFVKPQTLAYLLMNGHLKEYVIQSWKGKDKKHYRGRYKSWFPPEYGMLCQVTLYIIMMRIILCLDKTSLNELVFKAGLNISSLRQRKNESLGIYNMGFYSIRYAAAEEDCRYNIPSRWIKWRMGHSIKSQTRFKYANNLDMRVTMDNVRALLGSDVSDVPNDDNAIPLECKMFNGGFLIDTEQISNVPQDIIEELKEIKKTIKSFMILGGSLDNYPQLRVSQSINEILADLKMIPLGSFFQFKEGMLSGKQQKDLDININTIQGFFHKVSVPKLIPIIWSYAQVMYGIWHNDFKQKTVENFNAMQAQDVIAKIKDMIELAEGKQKMPQKTLQTMFKEGTINQSQSEIKKKKATCKLDKKSKKRKVEQWDLEIGVFDDENSWHMMNIEVGNVVAIICGETCDNTSIKVPHTNHYIWLCKVVSIKRLKFGEISAYMYTGNLDELSLDSKLPQKLHFKETSIVSIFEDDESEEFNLSQENIDDMVSFIRSHYH
jgi:hypothetical protein